MKPYILFIDSEASGLPKKWNLPYSASGNWPHIVQLSWLIYTSEGIFVKEQNYYINNSDFTSAISAVKVHGITESYRKEHGVERRQVMEQLYADMQTYEPLIVGHFTELDMHFVGAEFHRLSMDNIAAKLPRYCTMKGTTHYVRNPQVKHLRLNELYIALFKTKLNNQHNSLYDARATADCFFELLKRGEVDDARIAAQQLNISPAKSEGYGIPMVIFIIITCLMAYFL